MALWWNGTDGLKPEYSEENLLEYHFVHHKYHLYRLGIEPWLCGEKTAANSLSHGTANAV
jgi:hypothetical protein